ncbi:MAG: DUF6161 domain-containing protein [Phycisphaerales bacterium JB050]
MQDKLSNVESLEDFIEQSKEFRDLMPSPLTRWANKITEYITRLDSLISENSAVEEMNPILDSLARVIFYNGDDRKEFLSKIFQDNTKAQVAYGAYAYLIRDDIFEGLNTGLRNPDIPAISSRINGIVLASPYSQTPSHYGVRPFSPDVYQSFDLPRLIEATKNIGYETKQAADDCVEQVNETLCNLNNELEEIIKRYETKYIDITDTYTKTFALNKPAAFWRRRRIDYDKAVRKHVRRFSVAVAISLVVFVAMALFALVPRFEIWHLGNRIAGFSINFLEGTNSLTKFLSFGTIVAVIFWILRILARHLISAQHMREDAAEREVLFTTYIALMQHNSDAIDSAERQIVLASLFRPTQDGFIKDDPGPSASVEALLTRLINK